MNPPSNSPTTILAVHPGAELFGSDRMFLESVIGMVGAGHRVVVVLPTPGPLAERLHDEGATVTIAPMLVLRKSLMKRRGWAELVRGALRNLGVGWRLITRYRPSTIYVSTLTLPLWPLIGRVRGIRVVSHVHEAELSERKLLQRVLYLPHLMATAIVVNSVFTDQVLLQSLPRLSGRSQVVYNGVQVPLHVSAPRAEIVGPLQILYVGRLSPRKGPDVALAALRLMRSRGMDVHLTLLGSAFDGYEWFERELHSHVRDWGLKGHVDFLGFEPEIWPRLVSTDIIVVPSVGNESFGNVVVEGILAMRPVIASDKSGLREAAGGYGSTFLVPPNDPAALCRAVRSITEDWPGIRAATSASAVEATARHDVLRYRESIAAIAVGGLSSATGSS